MRASTAVKQREGNGKNVWPLTNVVYLIRTFSGRVKYDSRPGTSSVMLVVQNLIVRTLGWMGWFIQCASLTEETTAFFPFITVNNGLISP